MTMSSTWIGYARSSEPDPMLRDEEDRTVRGVSLGPDAEDERTAPSVSVAADANAGEHVLTTSMLDELRRRLREAEEREESGIRLRPTPEDGLDTEALDPLADLEIDVEDPSDALDAALRVVLDATVPELEVALAPNSESNFYAGFDDEHPDGVFFATYTRLEVGAPAYVTVLLPAGHRFRTPALVEWVRPPEAAGPNVPAGVGLKMCGLDAEAQKLVRTFARHRRPIFYVD